MKPKRKRILCSQRRLSRVTRIGALLTHGTQNSLLHLSVDSSAANRRTIALRNAHMTAASRPGKLSHAQTMLYEIDMLRETARQLEKDKWQGDFHKWFVLEAFLLHFRNLIEFFGRPMPRQSDLSIEKPESFWTAANRPADAVLAPLRKPDLWTKYEGNNNRNSISKYLQHCTAYRIDDKDWPVSDMYNELSGTVDEFERLLPDKAREWPQPNARGGVVLLGPASSSTATIGRVRS